MRGIDPTNPEAMQQLLEGGMFEPAELPAQKAALDAARDRAGAGRGLGRRGRRPGHRRADAGRGQAAGGRTPPPRGRRSGRGDVRRAGRPGAAPAAAARRLHAVGLAAHPPGAPRPATASGCTPTCCPPLPTSTTRWASARARTRPTALSESDFDAELKNLLDERTRRRRRRTARGRLSLTAVLVVAPSSRAPRGVAVEPGLGPLGVGVAVDPRPEGRVVTRLQQVRELVHEHVVDDPVGHALQPARQPDGAVGRRAGAPARALVVDPSDRARLGRPPS